ncbi:Wzz/FepE/Etk N-terminal domain-containing protein [Methylophaga sp.]|uniref:Wzz/FepE/Etk N-terminal domain-containing protein n=1 Tax=Methylophaga sp. TaxID=2024840 RepID=UPI003A90C35B
MIKKSNSQKQLNHLSETLSNDEIDLFEIAELLWYKKIIIIFVTIACGLLGYGYTVYESNKPMVYQGKILLESGAYITKENELRNLHAPRDMAMMISTIKNVSASAPNGTSTLIEVTISDTEKNEILANFNKVYKFIEQQDNLFINKLDSQQIIKVTQAIDEPEITEKSKNRMMLVIILSITLGGMLGIFLVLIRAAIKNRRAFKANIK